MTHAQSAKYFFEFGQLRETVRVRTWDSGFNKVLGADFIRGKALCSVASPDRRTLPNVFHTMTADTDFQIPLVRHFYRYVLRRSVEIVTTDVDALEKGKLDSLKEFST